MTVLIAFADADQRVLRPQDRELIRSHRTRASVMTNLQHVHVAENPVAYQRLQHLALGVSRQDRAEASLSDAQDDARLIRRRIFDRLARPQYVEREVADDQAATGRNLANTFRTDKGARLVECD